MGATSAAKITTPAAQAATMTLGRINVMRVPFTCTMSTSYATGGDTWTPPTSQKLDMWKLFGIVVYDSMVSAGYFLDWNASTTAPKIQAYNSTRPATSYQFVAAPVATAGNDLTTVAISIPVAGTITAVTYSPVTTFTGATTNARHWAFNNLTQTLVPATFTGVGSGAAFNLTAGVQNAFTLGNASNVAVTAGDVFEFISTHDGTGLADPGGIVTVTFAPTNATSEVTATTNLSAITVLGEALYWN